MQWHTAGAPLAYTPFCDNNKDMDGFRFWKQGFWKEHLRGRPYHISASVRRGPGALQVRCCPAFQRLTLYILRCSAEHRFSATGTAGHSTAAHA